MHCDVSHTVFSRKRNSLPRVLSSSCEILTNWVTQSGRKCAYHEGWYTVTYIFYKQFFFIVLPPLKIYFSCASTVTSLHDSFSSTYESLLIFTCSQFLGDCYYWPSVSCCLFFCQALVFRVFMTEWCSYKWTDTKWNEAFNQKLSQLLSVNSVYDECFMQAFATIMHVLLLVFYEALGGEWGGVWSDFLPIPLSTCPINGPVYYDVMQFSVNIVYDGTLSNPF